MNPMRSVSGVPATIVARRSRPWRSVPNGCAIEGAWTAGAERGRLLLVSTTTCPTITKSPRAESRTTPTTRERLRRRYPTLLRPSIADARIEQRIDDVEDQGRDPESHDDREHDSLDEEVIILTNGVE